MYRKIKWLFYMVISVFFILRYSMGVKAATADDLREVIGERRITDETLISDVKTIIYQYQQNKYRKKLIRILESKGDFGYSKQYQELGRKKESSLKALETVFCSNKDVISVMEELDKSLEVLNELGALKAPDSYILNGFGDGDDKAAYEYAASVMKSLNDKFDLGKVGEGLTPPTKDQFKVSQPFGKNAIVTSDIKYEVNHGVDFYVATGTAKKFKAKIVSQFNGKVDSVKKVKKNKYRVRIKHGISLVTNYAYLSEVKVKKGDKVKQYGLLGYAAEKTLHFEVKLNTALINPLFLYGDGGEAAYQNWNAVNPGMATTVMDFTRVKKYPENNQNMKTDTKTTMVVTDGEKKKHKVKLEGISGKPNTAISDEIQGKKTD